MKRSKAVALTLMSASAVMLQACDDQNVEAQVFQDLQGCIDAQELTEAQCREVYQGAVQEHLQSAPRYATEEECIAAHGAEACQAQQTASGGSIFMPLMMGYLAGRMMGGGYGNPNPLYRDARNPGNFRTADNKPVPGQFGKTTLPKWASETTRTRTQSVSRGGFGNSNRSYAG